MIDILMIDDDSRFSEIAKAVLENAGYFVEICDCPANAFPILMERLPGLLICDLHMPFTTGLDQNKYVTSFEAGIRTIRELRKAIPQVPIMAMSAAPQIDLDRIAEFIDPTPVLTKPSKPADLVRLIENMLDFGLIEDNLSGEESWARIN